MSSKAVREYHGKKLLAKQVALLSNNKHIINDESILITEKTDYEALIEDEPWLTDGSTTLVVKPDQLIKRRGKAGLVGINLSWEEVKEWIKERMGKEVLIENKVTGILDTFLVEPFVKHDTEDEYYICIQSNRDGEEMLFHHEGGVDIGDVDSKANKLNIGISEDIQKDDIMNVLVKDVPIVERKEALTSFLAVLFQVFRNMNFTYMEINPIVFNAEDKTIVPLDLAAKIDETASFLQSESWGYLEFPVPFGRKHFPEEAYIHDLDGKTGASLKLTILNPEGRIWTMVAGGGASVVYADTISDFGFGKELANYGEYSGAPSTEHTYEYAKTIISLMTRKRHTDGKILIIGGGIANFTDVAATFKGLIKALISYQDDLKNNHVQIWVRRAGPNYQEGLSLMRDCSNATGLNIHIYGPETHITAIVPLALGLKEKDDFPEFDDDAHLYKKLSSKKKQAKHSSKLPTEEVSKALMPQDDSHDANHKIENFCASTRGVVYGLQNRAVQGMLDFDFMCKRSKPSVA